MFTVAYLRNIRGCRLINRNGRGISDHHVVLYKVSLVGKRIKRREVVDGLEVRNGGNICTEKNMLDLLR